MPRPCPDAKAASSIRAANGPCSPALDAAVGIVETLPSQFTKQIAASLGLRRLAALPLLVALVALSLLVAAAPAAAEVALPKPVRIDLRDPTPRPDLVDVGSALAQPLRCALSGPAKPWQAAVEVRELEQALRQSFGKAAARFDPPFAVRVVLKGARAEVRGDLLQVRLVVHVFDRRDRSRQFQGPGDGDVQLGDVGSQAQLQQALAGAVQQAADHAALQFVARMGAPETALTHHRLWLGGQVGGLGVWGVSALWPLRPQWLGQVSVNPLGPRLSASLGAGRRLHGDDEAELRGWAGLTAELPYGLVKFCSGSCQETRLTRLYTAWLLEFAWQFGDGLGQRFAVQAGLVAGVAMPQWNQEVNRYVSPWGGLGYWFSW